MLNALWSNIETSERERRSVSIIREIVYAQGHQNQAKIPPFRQDPTVDRLQKTNEIKQIR